MPKGSYRRYLFTSESVGAGHPDKVADQVSDAVLDSIIAADPKARVACETFVTTGLCVVGGEVTVHTEAAKDALLNVEDTVRQTIAEIGYTEQGIGFDAYSCAVMRTFHNQSPDINIGVDQGDEVGAGDQGMMFGFACKETSTLMPMPIYLSHRLMEQQAKARVAKTVPWLLPDCKGQVTVEYEGSRPVRITTIVFSTQHTEEAVDPKTSRISEQARSEFIEKVIRPVVTAECPQLWDKNIKFLINPTGRFVIGGPHGDTGLTGRKIIVDTYGGRGRHGGGAFSGKDPSKVDRSACYMARYIAKNIVAADLAEQCEVQLAYAIGVIEPVSVLVDTQGTGKIDDAELEKLVREVFPLTPRGIIRHLNLLRPIYRETARYGHFGRELPQFTWEKTDMAAKLKTAASAGAAV
jgi:S-adenosylmethionine synthetase